MTKLKQARPLLSTTRYTVARLIRNGLPISAVANAGPLPDGGYFNGVSLIPRAFLENNDPVPSVAGIKAGLKIYP
jgi:hypothetical protein